MHYSTKVKSYAGRLVYCLEIFFLHFYFNASLRAVVVYNNTVYFHLMFL
jgi:hypothetical protein